MSAPFIPKTNDFAVQRRLNDDMFRRRIQQFPEALQLGFWENHVCTREALSAIPTQGEILDFGCGTGEIDILLGRAGRMVTGWDISPVALQVAREHLSHEREEVRSRVRFVQAEDLRLPFADQTFDSVLMSHVLEHLAHPTPVMKDIVRVLKPGGTLLVVVPHGHAFPDDSHVHFFEPQPLRALLSHYFEEVEVSASAENQQLTAVCRNREAVHLPRILCQMRVKNEERWLKDVLDSIALTADGIVILDDGSTDRTGEICKAHPAVAEYQRQSNPVLDEVRDKNILLKQALRHKPDWVLCMDGDEILEDSAPERIFDAIRRCPSDVAVLDLEFLYMWNDLEHCRTDGIYARIFHHRLFTTRRQDAAELSFPPSGYGGNFHCESVPPNLGGRAMESDVKVKHLGYMCAEDRSRKYEWYKQHDPEHGRQGYYEHLLDQPGMTIVEWQERPFRTNMVSAGVSSKQEFKPDYYYANARRNLADLVPQNATRVLDVGCGHGMTGGLLRAERGIEVVGIEIHEETAAVSRQYLTRVIAGDIETMELPFEEGSFDCIMLGDVLEHLINPWQALQKLVRYLHPAGSIVASIPNIRNLGVMKKVLEGSWSYEEWGILDKSHLRFFALKDMFALFEQAGIDAKVVEVVRDPLFEREMQSLPTVSADVNLGNFVVPNVSPQDLNELTAQQFIFTGTLKREIPAPKPQIENSRPEISVIIPVFNNLNFTRQCITSLFTVRETVDFEVVVVDNGSTDGTAEYLRQLPATVRTVSSAENRGFAKGCNAGARVARGKYLVFLNNDTVVQPKWLSAMLECITNDSAVGLVGNLQIFPDGNKVQQAGIVCGADQMVYSIYNNEVPADHPAVNKPREFQFVAGSCMLIEKKLFDRLGGFEENYLNSCEDIDLCMKVREAGRKVFYCPESRILHYESRTVKGHDKSGANYKLFLARWGDKLVRDDVHYLQEDGMIPVQECAKPRQPKVAILTTFNQYCGLATYAEYLVCAMQELGLEPVILAEKNTPMRGTDPAHVIRCWTRGAKGGDELVTLIHKLGIEVLHVNHGGMFALDGWLPDVLRTVRKAGVRVAITFHTTESDLEALGELTRRADRVLVHHAQNELELLALGGTPGRIEVVPHGIPKVSRCDIFESKLNLHWDPARKVVSTFGFVEPHKGVFELIGAMNSVREKLGAELHVLGGPHPGSPESQPYIEACKRKVTELGLDGAVHFAESYLSEEEVSRRLRASDVIVMNYQAHRYESSGAAMIALASGRPMVSSCVPSFEFAPGLTYKATDVHHLSQAIIDVLTNPFIAGALLQNLMEFEKVARWDVVARRVMDSYRAVLDSPPQHSLNMMRYYGSHPDDIYAEPLQRERVQWLKSRAVGKILEIGPANGYVSDYVGGTAAVDISRGRLEVAQALRPSVRFQFGDVVKGLRYAEHEFDTVLAPEILEHMDFEDAVAALKECLRVGRRVLVTLPNADKPDYDPSLVHNVEHRWLVNREAVDRLLVEAGCTSYELDTSNESDFYLLEIRSDADRPKALIHEGAAQCRSNSLFVTEPLQVGIDISGLEDKREPLTEAASYAIHTVSDLMKTRPQWEFTVFGNAAEPLSPDSAGLVQSANHGYCASAELTGHALDVVYLCDPLSARAGDILQNLLLKPALLACAFHDLIPLRFADAYLKSEAAFRNRYLHLLRLLKERCDLFVCASQSTAQDLQARLEIPHGRLRIVHGAASDSLTRGTSPADIGGARHRYALDNKRFLLCFGAGEHHKNIARMLFALSAVRQVLNEDVRLVMAGDMTDATHRETLSLAADCALPEDALTFVAGDAVGALRGCAEALLHPSLWEGSGMRILDAMSAGLPVIAGNNSAQAEVCNDAALLIDAEDEEEIARAIISVLQSPALRQELTEKGVAQSRRFTWRKAAEKTAIYLAECVSKRRPLPSRTHPQSERATV